MRGLLRTLSNSSSLRVIGNCWMLNESAPAWLRIASLTDAFSPWISDTTAMIDVTATMLPSTVMNDRSLAAQIASSAISADSRNLFIELSYFGFVVSTLTGSPSAMPRTELYGPVITWSPALRPDEHLEVLVAGDAHLDRHELGLAVADDEHAFGFLARLARLELGGGAAGAASAPRRCLSVVGSFTTWPFAS